MNLSPGSKQSSPSDIFRANSAVVIGESEYSFCSISQKTAPLCFPPSLSSQGYGIPEVIFSRSPTVICLCCRDALPIAPHIRYGVFGQVVRKPGARVEFPLFHERHCGSSGYRLVWEYSRKIVSRSMGRRFRCRAFRSRSMPFFAVLDNQDICTGCVAVMYRFLNSGKYFFLHDTITPLRFDLSANISYHKSAIFTRAFQKTPRTKNKVQTARYSKITKIPVQS